MLECYHENTKLEILSVPEMLREGIASLSKKLALAQSKIIELENKNDELKKKLMEVTILD